ncbi:MAG: TraR/DksA family transcriptional regulator [Cyclobacteriaceae bacterium]
MMDQEQRREIETTIKEEIEKTKNAVADYREMTRPIAPENAIGRISRMDAINNKSVAEAALRKAEEKLKGLHFVLDKIDQPDFGLCEKCKKPIPIGRIMLMPQSRLCIHCAH